MGEECEGRNKRSNLQEMTRQAEWDSIDTLTGMRRSQVCIQHSMTPVLDKKLKHSGVPHMLKRTVKGLDQIHGFHCLGS